MKKFTRTVEDFTCEHCGVEVKGSGYTNHCPQCLWSMHVDINPGDRQAECGGMMEPVGAEQKKGGWRIVHKCQKCGVEKANKITDEDSQEVLLGLISN